MPDLDQLSDDELLRRVAAANDRSIRLFDHLIASGKLYGAWGCQGHSAGQHKRLRQAATYLGDYADELLSIVDGRNEGDD